MQPRGLKRILEIEIPNRCVLVQPGVTDLAIADAVHDQGFHYAPNLSSQSDPPPPELHPTPGGSPA